MKKIKGNDLCQVQRKKEHNHLTEYIIIFYNKNQTYHQYLKNSKAIKYTVMNQVRLYNSINKQYPFFFFFYQIYKPGILPKPKNLRMEKLDCVELVQ